ncbi:tRNA dihydrouridine(20/20a) synthase DusA [Idiomarina seosinensis]|uniref:tRNA dihydrouridine(20/20a) synthase DusA n=1 Tax=Idiomarina seosinensis TaxID=281739 RepID=UPI00385020A3
MAVYPYLTSVAPMLDWTDRHCRYFHRLLSKQTLLYTEMVTTGAILFGQQDFLQYNQAEQPVALQLGGSDPKAMARCAEMAQQRGYNEVNINVGCPSDRVQNGSFGACLMAQPQQVAHCVAEMQAAVDIPVTVKTRLGIDEHDSDEFLYRFLDAVVSSGVSQITLHARKAWLSGLSPKENREVPPLQYERVYQAKQRYLELPIAINGGIKNLAEIKQHLSQVDSVMVGREAYQNPWLLTQFDELAGGADTIERTRESIALAMVPYIDSHINSGGRAWHVVRHMLGLFQGQPGGKKWRQYLSIKGPKASNAEQLITGALRYRQDRDSKLVDLTN